MAKYAPKAFPNPAQHVPKPSKIEAWDVPGRQNAPKRCFRPAKRRPRAPKKRPRGAQEAPKRHQEPPKSGQKRAKQRPRGTQECHKPIQNGVWRAPRRVFSMIFVGSSVRQAPGAILRHFWSCVQHANVMKTLEKPWFFQGFCLSRAGATSKPVCTKNRRKISLRGSKNVPRCFPNPPKSSLDQSQTAKKRPRTPTSSQETHKRGQNAPKRHPRSAQERPRSAQERKIAPTWAEHLLGSLILWPAGPPPRRLLKAVFSAVYKSPLI